jgi:hypothetical protein
MATVNKQEKIFVNLDGVEVELTGADKEAFLEQRAKDQTETEKIQAEQDQQKALKVSAYTKLGLTQEEINSIL